MTAAAAVERITYNVGNAKDARVRTDLDRLLARRPVVVGLNEIGDRRDVVMAAARATGYEAVIRDVGRASDHIGFLVSPDVDLSHVNCVPISPRTKVGRRTAGARRTGWTEAKYLLIVRYRLSPTRHVWADDVGPLRVDAVTHLVPSAARRGNDRTRQLHHQQTRTCARWLEQRVRPATLMGDLNADVLSPRERDLLLRPLDRVATLHGAPSHGRRGIDVFATAGVRGSVVALRGFSSDHRPVVFTEHGGGRAVGQVAAW